MSMSNQNTLAIALASLLVGGVAVAAFQNNRVDSGQTASSQAQTLAAQDQRQDDRRPDAAAIDAAGGLGYAQVIDVRPITEQQPLYAQVIGSEALRETSTSSSPQQVCQDVAVQERLPERDGNVGGTVAGAIIGGLVGNQIGGGDGRKAATAAGAVAGGFIGNRVDRNHVGGQVVSRTDRQCRTVNNTSTTSRVVAYNVTYRNPDGTTGSMRSDSRPGERIRLGNETRTVGYDVTYRYAGEERSIRMDQHPGQRLPVIDGRIATQTVAVGGNAGDAGVVLR